MGLAHVAPHLSQHVSRRSWPLLLENRSLVEHDFPDQAPFHFKWKE
jgi:hypothetical protein